MHTLSAGVPACPRPPGHISGGRRGLGLHHSLQPREGSAAACELVLMGLLVPPKCGNLKC